MSPLRRWAALAVLLLPVLLIAIDMSVLGVAVPALSADLAPTSAQLLWIIDVYSFLLAGLLITAGSLGDRIGRRRLLLIGAPVFGAASLLAALSTTPSMLIAARALLGLGGATLMPSTLGLIRTIFTDRAERRTAVAVWAGAFSGGGALGPVVGGLLLEHFPWGSVFLMNVPVIVLFLATAPWLLPEARDPRPGPFDLPSAGLSIVGLLGVVYALKTAATGAGADGTDATAKAAAAGVVGILALAAFWRRQRRLTTPLLDLTLFRSGAFAAAIGINVVSMFAFMGLMFFLPQQLMLVAGMSPAQAGLWLLPLSAATVLGTALAPRLAGVLGVRGVIAAGLACSIAGVAAGAFGTAGGMAPFLVLSALFGVGIGLSETLTNDVILTAAPPDRAGAASAISETGYELGGAMGTALLGTLGTAVYAVRLRAEAGGAGGSGAGGVAAGGVPGLDGADVEEAAQTLGAAHAVAERLPDGGARLADAADAAFLAGFHAVALVCAAVLGLTLLLSWRGLRSEARQA